MWGACGTENILHLRLILYVSKCCRQFACDHHLFQLIGIQPLQVVIYYPHLVTKTALWSPTMHESPLPELLAAAETETGNRFSVIDHRLVQGMDGTALAVLNQLTRRGMLLLDTYPSAKIGLPTVSLPDVLKMIVTISKLGAAQSGSPLLL